MFAKLSFAFEVESPSYLKEDLRKPERVKIVILLKKRTDNFKMGSGKQLTCENRLL